MGCMAALEAEKFLAAQRRHARAAESHIRDGTSEQRRGRGMDWDKLRVFHAVAEAGSFTHAGEALNLSQSAVSRQISALEESLERAAVPPPRPRPHPDRAGRSALSHRARGLRQARDDRGDAVGIEGPAQGPAQGDDHGRFRLGLADAAHPRVPRPLSRDPGQPRGRRQRTRSVDARGRCRHPHVAAAPARSGAAPPDDDPLSTSMPRRDYLKKHGTPQRARGPRQAPHHRLWRAIRGRRCARSIGCWKRARDPATSASRFSRSTTSTPSSARSKAGSASPRCPISWQQETRELVRILPELPGPEVEAYFVYPEELRTSKRIAVFRDFLLRKVAEGKNG